MPSNDGPAERARTRIAAATDPAVLKRDARVRAIVLGFLLGTIAVPVLVLVQGWLPRTASNTTFAFGALVLGFAVLSWSGAVMLGPAIEYLQDYMDLASGWTEAGARRAFSILCALGAGLMLGAVLGTLLLQWL